MEAIFFCFFNWDNLFAKKRGKKQLFIYKKDQILRNILKLLIRDKQKASMIGCGNNVK